MSERQLRFFGSVNTVLDVSRLFKKVCSPAAIGQFSPHWLSLMYPLLAPKRADQTADWVGYSWSLASAEETIPNAFERPLIGAC